LELDSTFRYKGTRVEVPDLHSEHALDIAVVICERCAGLGDTTGHQEQGTQYGRHGRERQEFPRL